MFGLGLYINMGNTSDIIPNQRAGPTKKIVEAIIELELDYKPNIQNSVQMDAKICRGPILTNRQKDHPPKTDLPQILLSAFGKH